MNIWLNSDGTRSRVNRPYIEQEELHRNLGFYDPNGPGPHYGLYTGVQPSAQRWVDYATNHNVTTHQPPATVWQKNFVVYRYV